MRVGARRTWQRACPTRVSRACGGAARAQRVPHGIGTASAEGIMIARGQGATAAWASTLTTAPHAAQSVLIGRLMAAGHVHVAISTALGRFTGLRTNERWHRHGT